MHTANRLDRHFKTDIVTNSYILPLRCDNLLLEFYLLMWQLSFMDIHTQKTPLKKTTSFSVILKVQEQRLFLTTELRLKKKQIDIYVSTWKQGKVLRLGRKNQKFFQTPKKAKTTVLPLRKNCDRLLHRSFILPWNSVVQFMYIFHAEWVNKSQPESLCNDWNELSAMNTPFYYVVHISITERIHVWMWTCTWSSEIVRFATMRFAFVVIE